MERFSTRYTDLHNQLKAELNSQTWPEGCSLIARFSEMPWFPGGQFTIFAFANNLSGKLEIIKKTWDHKYDLNRFSAGIYNLERLCIRSKNLTISDEKSQEFLQQLRRIQHFPETLEREDYILLDGIEYELELKTSSMDKTYRWKIPTADIEIFAPLLDILRSLQPA